MKPMRQVISQESTTDAKVCVTSSDRLSAVPNGVKLDHASCATAVAGGHLAASADGRFAAEVVRSPDGGFVVRHSRAELPDIPFRPEPGKAAPKILRVTETGVLAWASRPKQDGLFEIDDAGIHFRVEMQQCDGSVPGGYLVYGIHEEDGVLRRRFVRTASWSILDEPLWYDLVTGSWKTVEQQLTALADGRYVSVRRTRKGWERLLIGDGDTERAALTHAASVRSHLLAGEFVDILNSGHTYRLLFRGACSVHGGSVERSWQSPDGKRLLLVEVLSDQHDSRAGECGPQRRLVQLDLDGSRKTVASGRICLEPNAVTWTPDGRGYAAFVRQLDAMKDGFALYQDVVHVSADNAKVRTLPGKLPIGSRAREALVTRGGTVAALLVDDGTSAKLQVRGPSFGPYTFAWNLAFDDESGGLSFNAVIGNAIQRIVIS